MVGPISAGLRLGNTAPKKSLSGGESLATLSDLTGPGIEPQISRTISDIVNPYYDVESDVTSVQC